MTNVVKSADHTVDIKTVDYKTMHFFYLRAIQWNIKLYHNVLKWQGNLDGLFIMYSCAVDIETLIFRARYLYELTLFAFIIFIAIVLKVLNGV